MSDREEIEQLRTELAQALTDLAECRVTIRRRNALLIRCADARSKARAELIQAREELTLNARMLARQCNLAREAESERDEMKRQLEKKYTRQFGIAQEQAWRLALLDRAEAALAGCGIAGIYDTFDGLPDAIEQMSSHIRELGEQLETAESAEALAALVTPELPAMLERLVDFISYAHTSDGYDYEHWFDEPYKDDPATARALAARIREALEADSEN